MLNVGGLDPLPQLAKALRCPEVDDSVPLLGEVHQEVVHALVGVADGFLAYLPSIGRGFDPSLGPNNPRLRIEAVGPKQLVPDPGVRQFFGGVAHSVPRASR